MTNAHTQISAHRYVMHYPEHPARKDDPHYVDFNHYHKTHRKTAKCYVGAIIGFDECQDAKGNNVAPNDAGFQESLELHHAHVEFSLQNGISLEALETVYPGIANPNDLGAWVESEANFMWLCTFHHRGPGGAHTASASDFEAEKFVKGLISKAQ